MHEHHAYREAPHHSRGMYEAHGKRKERFPLEMGSEMCLYHYLQVPCGCPRRGAGRGRSSTILVQEVRHGRRGIMSKFGGDMRRIGSKFHHDAVCLECSIEMHFYAVVIEQLYYIRNRTYKAKGAYNYNVIIKCLLIYFYWSMKALTCSGVVCSTAQA